MLIDSTGAVLPGHLLDNRSEVNGEVCWLSVDIYGEILLLLDEYEGPPYERQLRQVRVDTMGARTLAWVYVGRRVPGWATCIPSGDWRSRAGSGSA